MELKRERLGEDERDHDEGVSPPPCKRPNSGEDDDISALPDRREQIIHNTIPGTNIKITSRGEGPDSSLVVSMELNGLTYQGILFQKPTS